MNEYLDKYIYNFSDDLKNEINDFLKFNLVEKIINCLNSIVYIYCNNKFIKYSEKSKHVLFKEILKSKKRFDYDTLNNLNLKNQKFNVNITGGNNDILKFRMEKMPFISILLFEGNYISILIYHEKYAKTDKQSFVQKVVYKNTDEMMNILANFHELIFYFTINTKNIDEYDIIKFGQEENIPEIKNVEFIDIIEYISDMNCKNICNIFINKYDDFKDYYNYLELKNANNINTDEFQNLEQKFINFEIDEDYGYIIDFNVICDEYIDSSFDDELKESIINDNSYYNYFIKSFVNSVNGMKYKSLLNNNYTIGNFFKVLTKSTNDEHELSETINNLNDYSKTEYNKIKIGKIDEKHIKSLKLLYKYVKRIKLNPNIESQISSENDCKKCVKTYNYNKYNNVYEQVLKNAGIKNEKLNRKIKELLAKSFITSRNAHISFFTIIGIILINIFQNNNDKYEYSRIINFYNLMKEYFVASVNKLQSVCVTSGKRYIENDKKLYLRILNIMNSNISGTIFRYDGDCELNCVSSIILHRHTDYKIMNEFLYMHNCSKLNDENKKINCYKSLENKELITIIDSPDLYPNLVFKTLELFGNLTKMKFVLLLRYIYVNNEIEPHLFNYKYFNSNAINIKSKNDYYLSEINCHALIKFVDNFENGNIDIYQIDLNDIQNIKLFKLIKPENDFIQDDNAICIEYINDYNFILHFNKILCKVIMQYDDKLNIKVNTIFNNSGKEIIYERNREYNISLESEKTKIQLFNIITNYFFVLDRIINRYFKNVNTPIEFNERIDNFEKNIESVKIAYNTNIVALDYFTYLDKAIGIFEDDVNYDYIDKNEVFDMFKINGGRTFSFIIIVEIIIIVVIIIIIVILKHKKLINYNVIQKKNHLINFNFKISNFNKIK